MTGQWIRVACGPSVAGGTHVLYTLDENGLAADIVCTQIDRSSTVATVVIIAHLAVMTNLPDSAEITTAGAGAAGRCIRFPGQSDLTGVHPIAEITGKSAIDDVVAIGIAAEPNDLMDTRGFLRPEYQDGRLVLLVESASGGVLRPVEIQDPHQCCGGAH